jgi:hypothetical protein
VSIGQKIQRKAEVEALKHLKPEYPKRRESSICEETLGKQISSSGKVEVGFFSLRTEIVGVRRPEDPK